MEAIGLPKGGMPGLNTLRKTGDRRTYEGLTNQLLQSLSQATEQPLNLQEKVWGPPGTHCCAVPTHKQRTC